MLGATLVGPTTGEREALYRSPRRSDARVSDAEVTRRPNRLRKRAAVKITATTTRDEAYGMLGFPDVVFGFGSTHLSYGMEDGRELRLLVGREPPHLVHAAYLLTPATGKYETLFENLTEADVNEGKPQG